MCGSGSQWQHRRSALVAKALSKDAALRPCVPIAPIGVIETTARSVAANSRPYRCHHAPYRCQLAPYRCQYVPYRCQHAPYRCQPASPVAANSFPIAANSRPIVSIAPVGSVGEPPLQCEKQNLRRSINSDERKTAHEPALGM